MADMNFTPAQQDAIDARNGSILVSAAAGSGKTRVLVQRVINLITNKNNPIDADRLLIVTFTNAAATEMKLRISVELDKKISENPNDEFLRRQQMILPRADICTIDSFCSKVIRENFFTLDINQNFRIGNNNELSVIQTNIANEIIEEMYASKNDDFILLSDIISGKKSDNTLEKNIITLYEKIRSCPFPEQWLENAVAVCNPEIPISKTLFGIKALEKVKTVLDFVKPIIYDIDIMMDSDSKFKENTNKTGASNVCDYYKGCIAELENAFKSESWSKISNCIINYKNPTYKKTVKKELAETPEEHKKISSAFNLIKTAIGTLTSIFIFTEDIYKKNIRQIYPAVKCLAEVLTIFDKRYFAAKKEKEILDFSDLEHLVIKLLYQKSENGYEKTDFAKSLSERYDEIMLDEYQDTNEIQEKIFTAISKDEKNLVVVGDVKQSIYGFRAAMPDIFIQRRENCTAYDRNNPQFPAKIILDKNFRSRYGILDATNFVFEHLMSKQFGNIEYNNDEKLRLGASYSENNEPCVELHIIENNSTNTENEENIKDRKEAKHIADIIKDMINSGYCVQDGETNRKAEYKDFCILLRNASTHAKIFADVLKENNIPAYTNRDYSLFECYEIRVILSFLKVVDNPVQDIPILSLMMSSIFGFTPDDLAEIKSVRDENKLKSLYASLLFINENSKFEDENKLKFKNKCINFIETMKYYRKLSVTVTTDTLTNMFLEQTGFLSIISAMNNGKIRIQNIHKFMNFIREYESSDNNGLTGFIRFVNHLEENQTDIKANDAPPVNSVRIMTIHNSKGLEFPVCIMAATSSGGNSTKDEVLYHSQLGFGINVIDREKKFKYSNFNSTIIKMDNEREEKVEELRILYVAMTRAKEKLIILSTISPSSKTSYEQKILNIANKINIKDGTIPLYSVESAAYLSDWIIMCALLHPSMNSLREEIGIEDIPPSYENYAHWKYFHIKDIEQKDNISKSKEKDEMSNQAINDFNENYNPKMLEFFKKRFLEKYKFTERTLIPTKVSASMIAHKKSGFEFIATSKPAFEQTEKLVGTERGTALHTFMQYADIEKIKTDLYKEKERLFNQGFISEEQKNAIYMKDINKFTESNLYKRMCNSEKLYREYRFTVNIKANDIDESISCEDNVILQGAVDCVFIEDNQIVIVDYKTDRIKDINKLSELYTKQLILYKKAVEAVFELPVKECIIYSLHLGEQIIVYCKS